MADAWLLIPLKKEDGGPGCGCILGVIVLCVIGFFVFRACSGGGI